jgi:hypothetical protein
MIARILLKQAATLMDDIHPRLKTAFKQRKLPAFEELIIMFKEYSFAISNIFVIFDALDECEDEYFRRILRLIRNLNDSGIRVYATAREHCKEEIDRHFQTLIPLILHMKIEARVEDVKKYLTQDLELRNTDEPDPEFEKEIVDVIANGVHGMYSLQSKNRRAYFRFLLARLRLDHVLKVRGKPLRRTQFHTFPVTEIAAYTEIMKRITSRGDSKKIILRVLSWIRYAKRLLLFDELREVIWVEEGDTQLKTKDINDFSLNHVIRNCESLVTCDKWTGRIRFSHTTVQEFLEKSKFACELMTHAGLAKTCLTYLNFEEFGAPCSDRESIIRRLKRHVFGEYAVRYWADHAGSASSGDAIWSDMLIQIIDTFLQDGKRESMQQINVHRPGILSNPLSSGKLLLHLLVESGLASYYMPPLSEKISNVDYTYVILFHWRLTKAYQS